METMMTNKSTKIEKASEIKDAAEYLLDKASDPTGPAGEVKVLEQIDYMKTLLNELGKLYE